MTITKTDYINASGEPISLFELKNQIGTTIKITNAGATITSIKTIDKNSKFDEITLGFNDPTQYLSEKYLSNCPYFGTTAGRFANRISKGKFKLDGQEFTLDTNNGNNHLHGGKTGFHSKLWQAQITGEGEHQKLDLTLESPDMDEGYPGNLRTTVSFHLTNQNELIIEYFASSDKATPVNLTNHTYFNLNGHNENILNHEVIIFADGYTENVDDIPTGTVIPVNDTPYDFSTFTKIGERVNELTKNAYDHNFVLNQEEGILARAAMVHDLQSGRILEVFTTMPGMQFYTGYYLDGSFNRSGKPFNQFDGFCMETQYFPDSPNKPHFPNCIATPDKPFKHTTVFKFGIES
jgi:aldose 1-epimerase